MTGMEITPYAKVAAKLLQGDMDLDDLLWKELLLYENELRSYFAKIGISLIVSRDDGYAFLTQKELDDEGGTIGLVRRTPLSFDVSFICVLLREWLDEFETSPSLSARYYIRHGEIRERIELFFQENSNQVKFLKDLDLSIRKIVDLGFLREVSKNASKIEEMKYWVKPILKAKISIEQLQEYKNHLENHVRSI
ncbi:MAG: DUF4194 domain-containing protein [Spirochaetota bacterium]